MELQLFIGNSYVTVTGDHVASSPLEVAENQAYIDWIVSLDRKDLSYPRPESAGGVGAAGLETPESVVPTDAPSPDRVKAIVDAIHQRGKITKQLFAGQGKEKASHSVIRLCHALIPWCKRDAALIDAVFRHSKLIRPKWDQIHKNRG